MGRTVAAGAMHAAVVLVLAAGAILSAAGALLVLLDRPEAADAAAVAPIHLAVLGFAAAVLAARRVFAAAAMAGLFLATMVLAASHLAASFLFLVGSGLALIVPGAHRPLFDDPF
ncbi:MAG TPA: hypothetical protein VM889_02965 [Candidatus Thermoplasmatota archaeon]|nr:hypothetical protein [Candidatus Thermoplasmatota archaeon]